MKRQRWLLLGLMVVVLSWAPVAQASTASFDFRGLGEYSYTGGLFNEYEYDAVCDVSGSLSITPTATGLITQQQNFISYLSGGFHTLIPWNYRGPDYITVDLGSAYFAWQLSMDQSGQLRFTDLTWEIKYLKDGPETTFFQIPVSADLINNGGFAEDYGKESPDLGVTVTIPISWTNVGDVYYTGSGSFYGNGPIFTLSVTGHVAPAPPSLILLVSGLAAMAGLGWRRARLRS